MANYCIAGLTNRGKWIRLISANPHIEDAVPVEDSICTDGTEVNLLDVVKVRLLDKKVENPFQPENFYYDGHYRWEKLQTLSLQKTIKFFGNNLRDFIFYNDDRSIDSDFIKNLPPNEKESLIFLPVKNLVVKVDRWEDYPKFYAHFIYNGKRYFKFSVGDIAIREQFKDKPNGEYFFRQNAYVVFSLTNPFQYNNKCYKMVAQVF